MKTSLLTFLLLFSATVLHGQANLVLNPSFEDTLMCPWELNVDVFLARHWTALDTNWNMDSIFTVGTHNWWIPDIENRCGHQGGGAGACPNNYFFYQYPRTGNTMMELSLYCAPPPHQQFYLQGRLTHTLISGVEYCVAFYMNMENSSGYAINKIGAYLDDGSIDTVNTDSRVSTGARLLTMFHPQVVDTDVISDTVNWVRVQGSFIANGTERFITIGVFDTVGFSKITYYAGSAAAYLIDDVSVVESNTVAFSGHDTAIHRGDTVRLGQVTGGDGMPCYWYKKGFPTPIDSGGTLVVHPDTTTSYVVMMDLCGHVTYDTVTVTVHTVGIANVLPSLKWVSVYPNPASSTLTIEAPAGCEVYINDIVGTTVYTASLMEAKTAVPIVALQPGVYFITVADPVSGGKVVKRVVKE